MERHDVGTASHRTRGVKRNRLFGKILGFAYHIRIAMEAERQNQLAARLADYAAREQALRGYL